jgi:hypothetical protein
LQNQNINKNDEKMNLLEFKRNLNDSTSLKPLDQIKILRHDFEKLVDYLALLEWELKHPQKFKYGDIAYFGKSAPYDKVEIKDSGTIQPNIPPSLNETSIIIDFTRYYTVDNYRQIFKAPEEYLFFDKDLPFSDIKL